MVRVNTNGTSFEFVERGKGDPVVLVHGSASDLRTWDAQREVLGESFRTIAYSRRYHWPNAPITSGADYAMAEHVDDLSALLPVLNAAPAHLVGHSYGAFICLLLTIQAPQLVRTLVLIEPPVITLFVSNVPRPGEVLRLALARPRTAAALVRFGATGLGPATAAARHGDMQTATRIYGKAVLGSDRYRRLSASRREQVRDNLTKEELLGSGFPRLDDERVRSVRAPTLLVCAAESPALFHRLSERLAQLLPEPERVEIPDSSHMVHEDNPRDFNAALLAFLARHSGSARLLERSP
jgi:pimeloyl-ACP methyl ester carboxylesterase